MQLFILTYTGSPIGESGECCNTTFDFISACKTCGTGATVSGALRTKGLTKISKDFFQTIDGDTIISAKLQDYMVMSNIKIGDLNKVVDYRGHELPYYHLTTHCMLPKADDMKGLVIEDQCSVCKQNGYFNDAVIGNIQQGVPTIIKPVELSYNSIEDSLIRQSDLFFSWEHMGKSNLVAHDKYVVGYARPLLIVSKAFHNFLTSDNIKNIDIEAIDVRHTSVGVGKQSKQ